MRPDRYSEEDPEKRFQELFEQYYRPVTVFFMNRGFSVEESRDLAQDTFLRVYKGMDGFRGEARVATWLFKIATHIGHNAVRYKQAGKRSQEEVSLEEVWERGLPVFGQHNPSGPKPPQDQLDEILSEERTRELERALGELPPKMRRCVLLRIQGLKYREIAVVTRVSIQTVKAQLHQARRQLKEKLGEYFATVGFGAEGGEDDG